MSLLMFTGGALTSFFGGAVYVCSGDANVIIGAPRLFHDAWLSFVMTVGTFATNALFTSMQRENWTVLRQKLSTKLAAQLLVPSAMDVLITGGATISLSLSPPSLAAMLKTSMQLLSIAAISRVVQGKAQSCPAAMALCLVAVGVVVVVVADVRRPPGVETKDSSSILEQVVGISLALAAGHLGAWRNVFEEGILKEQGLPSSALLMCESFLSAMTMGCTAPLLWGIIRSDTGDSAGTAALVRTFASPLGLTFLVLFWLSAYVKDAGKFWLLKNASPLRQKMVAMAFPFGTWAVGLLVFYCFGGRDHVPFLGARWSMLTSDIKLLGFITILAANVAFVLFKSGYNVAHFLLCGVEDATPDLSWIPQGRSYMVYTRPAAETHSSRADDTGSSATSITSTS